MKVVLLSAANSIHTVRWANSLADRGHEVSLIYNKNHGESQNKLHPEVRCFPLKHGGAKAYYLNAMQLRRLIKMIGADVINVHYASGYGTLARVAGIRPILLSVWGSDVYEFPFESPIKMKILKKNITFASMIASTSNCMAEQLENIMGRKMDISITPFGVDLKRFTGKKKKTENIIIGNIKTLKPTYGIDILIKAIDVLRKKMLKDGQEELFKKIKVLIYGEGSEKDKLLALIKKLELEKYVYLMGQIPNSKVSEVLGEMDIFCATSRKESFGVSVVEAMAMGCPVVVTDAEGFREVVGDRENGIIVPRDDVDAVAEGLELLVLNEELRNRYGEAGRKRVIENYNWEDNVTSMERVYARLVQDRK